VEHGGPVGGHSKTQGAWAHALADADEAAWGQRRLEQLRQQQEERMQREGDLEALLFDPLLPPGVKAQRLAAAFRRGSQGRDG
jgi:hypothetical protein